MQKEYLAGESVYIEKTWKNYMEIFFGHPVYLFVFTLVCSLIFAIVPIESLYRVIALLVLGLVWIAVGTIYARYKVKWEFFSNLPGRIRYHKVVKEIEVLNEEGDAKLKYTYSGENLGDTFLPGIFHLLRIYDSTGFLPDEVEGSINGEPTKVRVDSMSKAGKDETTPSKFESKFSFKFPTPIPPKSPLPVHSFTATIKGYCKGFDKLDNTVHTIDVLTDLLVFRLVAGDSLILKRWKHSVEDFHEMVDIGEMGRIGREGLLPECSEEKVLTWKIRQPKLTNRYVLHFRLGKSD